MCDAVTFGEIRKSVDGHALGELTIHESWRAILEMHAKAHDEEKSIERMARTQYVDMVLVSSKCPESDKCKATDKEWVVFPKFRGFYVRVEGKLAGLEFYER
jgi:hypothetical protein